MRIATPFLVFSIMAISLSMPLLAQPAAAFRVRKIVIEGNEVTRPSVILREMNVHVGDQVDSTNISSLVKENERRLLNLTLFTSVAIAATAEDSGLSLSVKVHERFYIIPRPILQLADRNFNVWWTEMHADLRRVNIGMKVSDNNFRGNLETLTAIVQAGYTQQLALEYIRPYVDKHQQQGIGLFGSVSQSGELAFKTDSDKQVFAKHPGSHIVRNYSAGVSWYYRPAYAFRHSINLSWQHTAISDTVLSLNNEYIGKGKDATSYLEFSYRLDVNKVNNWNYPLKGFKSVSYALWRQGLKNFESQAQIRTETGLFGNVPILDNKNFYSFIFRGRLAFQMDVPYFLQTALGTKTDYVRGYEYYVVDGSHYALLRLDLKREIFSKTFTGLPFHYLPSLPLRIYPKLFADAGMVHNPYPGNSSLKDKMLYSAGFGLDIVSAYDLKIRIEAAVNRLGQYGLYLHLNSE